MHELIDYWRHEFDYWRNEVDWRAQATRLNTLPHFVAYIDGVDITISTSEAGTRRPCR